MNAVKDLLKRLIGPTFLGAFDYYRDKDLLESYGGPFNGQPFRREIVQELVTISKPTFIVETGTFRGTSTEHMARLVSVPVHTIEYEGRFYGYSRVRLRKFPHVHVHNGDSRTVLRELIRGRALPFTRGFFYLDAHWGEDLPLAEELELIFSTWPSALILIDDFQVPNDPGYYFDDYGPGKALTVDYLLPIQQRFGFSIWFPACPSARESGARRGSVVLGQGDVSEVLALAGTLWRWNK